MRPPTDGDPFRFRNLLPTTPGLSPAFSSCWEQLPWAGMPRLDVPVGVRIAQAAALPVARMTVRTQRLLCKAGPQSQVR